MRKEITLNSGRLSSSDSLYLVSDVRLIQEVLYGGGDKLEDWHNFEGGTKLFLPFEAACS